MALFPALKWTLRDKASPLKEEVVAFHWEVTSITDTQMPPNKLTLLLLVHDLPDDRGFFNSQQGC